MKTFATQTEAEEFAKRERDAYGFDDRAPAVVVVEVLGGFAVRYDRIADDGTRTPIGYR